MNIADGEEKGYANCSRSGEVKVGLMESKDYKFTKTEGEEVFNVLVFFLRAQTAEQGFDSRLFNIPA